MLRANQAVRLGLRAASRNPELAFGRALLDQLGNLLALLPLLLAGFLLWGSVSRGPLLAALSTLRALRWPTAGGVVAAAALAFTAGMLFWSGALPLLAADEELDRRPPSGNFAPLAGRGLARVLVAGGLAYALSFFFTLACAAAALVLGPALPARPSPALFGGVALVATAALAGTAFFDVLGRLLLVRAAAFGEGVSAAFGKAATLLLARLGACAVVTAAFIFLDLVVAAVAGMLTGVLSGPGFLRADAQLLAVAPRIAVGLATATVLSWLEVGRMAAFAALALDAEGLLPEGPPPPAPVPLAEPVVEALPVED